jgi:nicotinamidase-related amidase
VADDRLKKRVWDPYISEPFLSKVAQQREPTLITKNSALLVIDLYNLVYEGGNRSVQEDGLLDQYPATCGEKAYQAIEPTNQLISLFRDRALPIIFSTKDFEKAQKDGNATLRPRKTAKAEDYEIFPEIDFRPTDKLIKKLRASVFFDTGLNDYLTRLDVVSLFIVGESTSGCVRASVVDAFSLGYRVCVVEDCVFDQNPISHAVNLYDMQHKYGQVTGLSELKTEL